MSLFQLTKHYIITSPGVCITQIPPLQNHPVQTTPTRQTESCMTDATGMLLTSLHEKMLPNGFLHEQQRRLANTYSTAVFVRSLLFPVLLLNSVYFYFLFFPVINSSSAVELMSLNPRHEQMPHKRRIPLGSKSLSLSLSPAPESYY